MYNLKKFKYIFKISQRILNKYHIEIDFDFDIALREVVNKIFGMIMIMEII